MPVLLAGAYHAGPMEGPLLYFSIFTRSTVVVNLGAKVSQPNWPYPSLHKKKKQNSGREMRQSEAKTQSFASGRKELTVIYLASYYLVGNV